MVRTILVVLGCVVLGVQSASIYDSNSVVETPRINSGDELISAIMADCFAADTMSCLKVKVLTYLDSKLGLQTEQGRSFEAENIDKTIYDRMGRILATNEFSVTLPDTLFSNAKVTLRGARGFDLEVPEEAGNSSILVWY